MYPGSVPSLSEAFLGVCLGFSHPRYCRRGSRGPARALLSISAEPGPIACEACDKINQRQTVWAAQSYVNQAQLVPEWIRALSAPQKPRKSPAEDAEQITWHYDQRGPQVFFGDIAFYSGEWDARDPVGRIDTNRCPLLILTDEYDYSCTVELSESQASGSRRCRVLDTSRSRRTQTLRRVPAAARQRATASIRLLAWCLASLARMGDREEVAPTAGPGASAVEPMLSIMISSRQPGRWKRLIGQRCASPQRRAYSGEREG